MSNNIICPACGLEYSKGEKRCPLCGVRNKKFSLLTSLTRKKGDPYGEKTIHTQKVSPISNRSIRLLQNKHRVFAQNTTDTAKTSANSVAGLILKVIYFLVMLWILIFG